jgi:hypothetical protein
MTPDCRVLYGIDFSSAPTWRKPIVIAQGIWNAHAPDRVTLQGLTRLDTLEAFGSWLLQPATWALGRRVRSTVRAAARAD